MNYTTDKVKTIKISFIGDIMCEYTRLDDYKTDGGYCFDKLFASCGNLFNKSDYVVANLETPVAGKELRYSYKNYNFNTPEEILTAIKNCGIDMVTTANNHCLDRGIEGIDATIENIEKADLDHTGTTHSGGTPKPLIKNIGGMNVGFLSYTYGTEACYNNVYLKKCDGYRVDLLQNQELSNLLQRFLLRSKNVFARIGRKVLKRVIPGFLNKNVEEHKQSNRFQRKKLLSDIRYLKENNVDFIVMCLHSGGQFNDKPTRFTLETSKFLFDNGVDLIVCNHEHMIQGTQFSGKKDIAYCLGNFTSNYGIDRAPYDKDAQCSVCMHLYLSDAEGKITREYSFSILISEKDRDGIIITRPVFDAYNECSDEKKKEEYVAFTTRCVKRFLNLTDDKVYIPQEEFKL